MRCTELASKTGVGVKFPALGAKLDFYWQFHWQSAFLRHKMFSYNELVREARVGIDQVRLRLRTNFASFSEVNQLNS
jgi:hypothetical protein